MSIRAEQVSTWLKLTPKVGQNPNSCGLQLQNGIQKIWHHTISRSDPTPPPSGFLLTVIAQVDPAGIVETAESFMIDAAIEEFNVTMKGINAGRQDICWNYFENCFIWQKLYKFIPNLIL